MIFELVQTDRYSEQNKRVLESRHYGSIWND